MLNNETFLSWKENPVTQKFLEELHNEREELKEMLATGSVESESIKDVIGRAEAIRLILNTLNTYDDFAHFYMEVVARGEY